MKKFLLLLSVSFTLYPMKNQLFLDDIVTYSSAIYQVINKNTNKLITRIYVTKGEDQKEIVKTTLKNYKKYYNWKKLPRYVLKREVN